MSYRVVQGSLQEQFLLSRNKIQFYAGAFANGKTSCSVIKALQLAKDYPGSSGMVGRATYPRLNDSIREEFIKWCPPAWIKSFGKTTDNVCRLVNGSRVAFRYVTQTGVAKGDATSNVLSNNYDWIVFDQIDDSEFTEKDFDDLLGRLRGTTQYMGEDPSMPTSGPRWLIITSNPTSGWVYRTIVRPLERYEKTGEISDKLLCERDETGQPVLYDGKPNIIIDMVTGSTYDNAANLASDYIQTLQSTYTGVMRDRYLLGKWGAYEGLVYPTFDEEIHCIPRNWILDYLDDLHRRGYKLSISAGYDYGLTSPSCYGVAFNDHIGNTFIVDGYYEANCTIESQARMMKELDTEYGSPQVIHGDPSIFRRQTGNSRVVGKSVVQLFRDKGVSMMRGNNDILNGITKVSSHLALSRVHAHPVTGEYGAPHLYVASELDWFIDEITEYKWRKTKGDEVDMPVDKDDHAMDMTKYLLTRQPRLTVAPPRDITVPPPYMRWSEQPVRERRRLARHA